MVSDMTTEEAIKQLYVIKEWMIVNGASDISEALDIGIKALESYERGVKNGKV